MGIPASLSAALRPVTVIAGHYGTGKTNLACNLAIDLKAQGHDVTLVDLDIVNPYFRAGEQRVMLEARGVRLIAPVFAEAGSSLDVPSLRGTIGPAIDAASGRHRVIVDVGGDDTGSVALGRYANAIAARDHAMLYVANRFRNLVQEPADALENLREVEGASRIRATAIVNNSHLKGATTAETIALGERYAAELARLAGLPLACTTVPAWLSAEAAPNAYRIVQYVKTVWE